MRVLEHGEKRALELDTHLCINARNTCICISADNVINICIQKQKYIYIYTYMHICLCSSAERNEDLEPNEREAMNHKIGNQGGTK